MKMIYQQNAEKENEVRKTFRANSDKLFIGQPRLHTAHRQIQVLERVCQDGICYSTIDDFVDVFVMSFTYDGLRSSQEITILMNYKLFPTICDYFQTDWDYDLLKKLNQLLYDKKGKMTGEESEYFKAFIKRTTWRKAINKQCLNKGG